MPLSVVYGSDVTYGTYGCNKYSAGQDVKYQL